MTQLDNPLRAPVHVLNALLPIQFPAMGWESHGGSPKPWDMTVLWETVEKHLEVR